MLGLDDRMQGLVCVGKLQFYVPPSKDMRLLRQLQFVPHKRLQKFPWAVVDALHFVQLQIPKMCQWSVRPPQL